MKNSNVNLNLYRSFYNVVKYEGFTKASNYTLISQPALSNNIKKLEEELGTKLIERNKNNINLTKEGEKLYSKLEEIITILDNESYDEKEINIGCIRFVADNYLSIPITKFKKKHKETTINLAFLNNTELYQLLKKEQLDIVISRYPLFYQFEKNIIIEKIFDTNNVFACSKKFYNKEYKKFKKKDYIYPMILPDNSEKRRKIELYLIDNNINYKLQIEIPNSNLLKELIKNDLGIGYINEKFIEKEVNNDEIVILPQFKNLPIDNISILYNSKRIKNITKGFIKILKESIQKTNS